MKRMEKHYWIESTVWNECYYIIHIFNTLVKWIVWHETTNQNKKIDKNSIGNAQIWIEEKLHY